MHPLCHPEEGESLSNRLPYGPRGCNPERTGGWPSPCPAKETGLLRPRRRTGRNADLVALSVEGRQIGLVIGKSGHSDFCSEDARFDERTPGNTARLPPRPGVGRRVYDRGRDRSGWHGGRVSGPRRAAAASRRHQGAPPRARLPGRNPAAVHARGADRRATVPPAHRPDPRRRRGRRPGLLRDGPGRRRVARRPDQAARPAARGGGPADHEGDGRRAQRRPRLLRGAPRHQARQHPARGDARPGDGDGLRHRQGALRSRLRRHADGRRRGDRHPRRT